MKRVWGLGYLLAAALGLASPAARAEDACSAAPPVPASLAPLADVADYRPVLQACRGSDGRAGVAVRAMRLATGPALLIADPRQLTTTLEKAACWTCRDIGESDLAGTRMGRAIEASAEAPGLTKRGFLENAGLTQGDAPGTYVTGDLCPSSRPLERGFLERLAARGPHTPVALSISGLWLKHHFEDYRWIAEQQASGALDVLWTNHSYSHPFRRGVSPDRTFLLTPDLDIEKEILEVERLLIANGGTPSLFFRFPGLVSSDPLMQAARAHHLISLGTDAWLALGQRPKPGAIVLVHPNGNEPLGLKLFAKDEDAGAFSPPYRPLTDAPR